MEAPSPDLLVPHFAVVLRLAKYLCLQTRVVSLEGTYDFIGSMLAPYGLELDYDRIQAARPVIAEILR